VLLAVRAGGGYVTVPGLHGRSSTQVLVSPGVSVTWTQIEVADVKPDGGWTEHEVLDPFDL
jgi:hypothetical protein